MGSDVQGNKVAIPLVYADEYLCGTKMLDGIYEDEFAIYVDESGFCKPQEQALAYAYPPVAIPLEKNGGELTELSFGSFDNPDPASACHPILTTVYPENGYILARFCNYSDRKGVYQFDPAFGKLTEETDLLGNKLADSNGTLKFRPWEIKTVKIEL